jgi:hypothetical protein
MATGFCNVSATGGGDVGYYLREGECLEVRHHVFGKSPKEIKSEWKEIADNEIYGNKDLGIRGRHDAQVRKNYIFSVPNELKPSEALDRLEKLVASTPIKDCAWTMAYHAGEREGITNRHVHLLVNERSKVTMKKDRSMQKREFLANEIKPTFVSLFAAERAMGKTYEKRERLDIENYKADERLARSSIVASQVLKQSQERATAEKWLLDYEKERQKQEQEKAKALEVAAQKQEMSLRELFESREQERGKSRGMRM